MKTEVCSPFFLLLLLLLLEEEDDDNEEAVEAEINLYYYYYYYHSKIEITAPLTAIATSHAVVVTYFSSYKLSLYIQYLFFIFIFSYDCISLSVINNNVNQYV